MNRGDWNSVTRQNFSVIAKNSFTGITDDVYVTKVDSVVFLKFDYPNKYILFVKLEDIYPVLVAASAGLPIPNKAIVGYQSVNHHAREYVFTPKVLYDAMGDLLLLYEYHDSITEHANTLDVKDIPTILKAIKEYLQSN